ncbi:MAG: MucR family transcriptional regulator, partial [Bdellovibrionales bacterium]
MQDQTSRDELLALTTEIVASYVSNNTLAVNEISGVIEQVFKTLSSVNGEPSLLADRPKPAVPIKKSVTADYLICLEDGKKLKMLKRHLKT